MQRVPKEPQSVALPENAFLQKWSLNTEHGVYEGRLQKLRWEQRAPEIDVNPLENSDTEDRQTARPQKGADWEGRVTLAEATVSVTSPSCPVRPTVLMRLVPPWRCRVTYFHSHLLKIQGLRGGRAGKVALSPHSYWPEATVHRASHPGHGVKG